MNFPFSVIMIDVETSGDPDHRIVELGAVRLDPELRHHIDTYVFETLVDGGPMTQEVIDIHGITSQMLVGKPTFAQMRSQFELWCSEFEPYVLGSWSDFDGRVLRDEYRRVGKKFPHSGHMLDVKSVVWWEIVKHGYPSRRLPVDRAAAILGIPFEGQKHRALADAKMEAKLLQFVANNPGAWKFQAV